jgi:hypothetical protein
LIGRFYRRGAAPRKNIAADAATHAAAHAMEVTRKPAISAPPLSAKTPPRRAVATMPAMRAAALLKPEAEPV